MSYLGTPKVTAISEEQKEAFIYLDLIKDDGSTEDPMQGTLAFNINVENLDILKLMIKEHRGATDKDVRTPYPRSNEFSI